MATLVLTAVGSAFGPVGGAIGALVGRSIDARIFAPRPREGARLKELTVSGSSYGSPIAHHYGTMRAPGTIIWATDFKETENEGGGGKTQPSTTSFSYSASFAVALASRPIDRVGRIWADGNLLRGASGDLKTGGTLRIHHGSASQPRDPLLHAALGEQCPAHRGIAYAVFEDLDLTDFGNRIPALSFEVVAGEGAGLVQSLLALRAISAAAGTRFDGLAGFSHEGGRIGEIVALVDRLNPLVALAGPRGLRMEPAKGSPRPVIALEEAAAWEDGDFGRLSGSMRQREDRRAGSMAALRYYDTARDFQPGLQYAANGDDQGSTFEFPGAMSATDAQRSACAANARSTQRGDVIVYRVAKLDPAVEPGALVSVPGDSAVWQVTAWEWRERGLELHLQRHRIDAAAMPVADPGQGWLPPDRVGAATSLRVFEVPWDGIGSASERLAYAAIGAGEGRWPGARLYSERDGALADTGVAARRRARTGRLLSSLPASAALRFEPSASILAAFDDPSVELHDRPLEDLARWENRMLVGGEVLQFARAEPLGDGAWLLSGLLRGRGGTEPAALAGHGSGALVTMLDERLVPIDHGVLQHGAENFAAFGPADETVARAGLEQSFASVRPPCPVRLRLDMVAGGAIRLRWDRRARGGWSWLDEVEQPLVEQEERYEIGLGAIDAPLATWTSQNCELLIGSADAATLRSQYLAEMLWVRQVGTFARSEPAAFGPLP